ncbi:MAG: hypothetical protein JJU01_09265 [Alkalibacterium sp.]|nr:hypothetical protein [Alkalibacterium sp.]
MENGLVLNDFKLFIKYKKYIILAVTLIVIVAMVAFSIFTELRDTDETEDTTEIVEETGDITDSEVEELLREDRENLSQNDINAINDFLFEDAYAFRIYIENQDGSVFNRSNLMHEIFTSDQVIEDLENQADFDLDLIRDYFVDVNYNSNNVTFTITIGTGNPEANAAISQALFDSIAENEMAIINEKVIYLFEQPQSIDMEEDVQDFDVVETPSDDLLETILISSIIGIFLGAGLGVVAAYIHSLFEKKINPLFNYNLKSGDVFINFSEKEKSDTLVRNELWHAVMYPVVNKKIVLSQDIELIEKLKELAEQSEAFTGEIAQKVHQINPDKNFDEVIIITENGKTDKSWYVDQMNQVKVYKKESKVIKM